MPNQEILFRGFHPYEGGGMTIYVEGEAVQGRWVEGLPGYSINGEIAEIQHFESLASCRLFDVLPSTVGQYTGLEDKNGRKIFKGDIVSDGVCNYVVVFYVGAWILRLSGDSGSYHCLYHAACQREVIGTIFDNPELMEKLK